MPPFPLNLIGFVFDRFFAIMVNLLAVISNSFKMVHIGGELGWSIIIMTILVRFLLWPFMSSQIKVSRKMAELKPHLDDLKKKHGNDKQALAVAQAALYKEHGVNPAGGCLSSIIQIPIIMSLYPSLYLFVGYINPGKYSPADALHKINSYLFLPSWQLKSLPNPSFFGLNLGAKPSDFGLLSLFILIPVVTALLQYIQASMMTSGTTVKKYPSDSPKEKKEKDSAEDAMGAVQTQMKYMMPLMIGYFAFSFPMGLAIYWNTFTLIGILQQYKLSGWSGASAAFDVKKLRGGTKVTIERAK